MTTTNYKKIDSFNVIDTMALINSITLFNNIDIRKIIISKYISLLLKLCSNYFLLGYNNNNNIYFQENFKIVIEVCCVFTYMTNNPCDNPCNNRYDQRYKCLKSQECVKKSTYDNNTYGRSCMFENKSCYNNNNNNKCSSWYKSKKSSCNENSYNNNTCFNPCRSEKNSCYDNNNQNRCLDPCRSEKNSCYGNNNQNRYPDHCRFDNNNQNRWPDPCRSGKKSCYEYNYDISYNVSIIITNTKEMRESFVLPLIQQGKSYIYLLDREKNYNDSICVYNCD